MTLAIHVPDRIQFRGVPIFETKVSIFLFQINRFNHALDRRRIGHRKAVHSPFYADAAVS